ncbi:hypothetical protein PM082_022923 [Marasmius tenuissimus]|nr:hypothetical protein PM082_022923 [Marasmius tenuissimus]
MTIGSDSVSGAGEEGKKKGLRWGDPLPLYREGAKAADDVIRQEGEKKSPRNREQELADGKESTRNQEQELAEPGRREQEYAQPGSIPVPGGNKSPRNLGAGAGRQEQEYAQPAGRREKESAQPGS